MSPDLKVVQHDTEGLNGELATTKTPYSYWEVFIGSLKVKDFDPYNSFYCCIENQEDNKRKMLKFVRDLEEELCVSAYWCRSVKKVVETDVEESMGPVT